MNTSKIDYKKSEENGWDFTSRTDGNGIYVYYMSSGYYTINPYMSDGCIIARFDICGNDFVSGDAFYCKEDARDYLKDGEVYYVQSLNGYYKGDEYLARRRTIVSNLPTREEAMKNFTKYLDEEELKLFNDKLNEYGNFSNACSSYYGETSEPEDDCVLVTYIPSISHEKTEVKKKSYNTPNNVYHTYSDIDDWCKELNSMSSSDRFEWLKSMTKVENGEISVCGLEVVKRARSFRVVNGDYYYSFAPTSSRKYEVEMYGYLKGLSA